MTKHERIASAFAGTTPDRVPFVPKVWIDLAARITDTDLTEAVTDPFFVLETLARAAVELDLDAVRQFHFPPRKIEVEENTVYEVTGEGRRIGVVDMAGGLQTHLFDITDYNIEDPRFTGFHHYWTGDKPVIRTLDDAKRIFVPPKSFYEEAGCGANQREIIKRYGDTMPLFGDCSSATFAFYVSMRKMDIACMDLIDAPDLVHAVMEKGVAIAVEKGKFNADLGIKTLRLNDSIGNMSVISADHWREFVFPHLKDVCDELHTYDPDIRIYCHICGNLLPIIEDLVEAGLDCIAPLDPLGGFTCEAARNAVSEDTPLMGGVNTLSFIQSTPDEIREEAIRCMRGAGMNGAFILGSGCVVPRNARIENMAAVKEAVETYGVYRDGSLAE